MYITRLRFVFRSLFLTQATFPSVWIRPSKHGNHKVIVYFQFTLLFESRIGNFPKTLLLVSWARIQYARDGEGPNL
jgi:hypothetical protein